MPGGCPLYAAFEFDDAEGPVRDYPIAGLDVWTGALTGLVDEAVPLGHLRDDTDADQFVWQLAGIYLSHHLSHRLMRDPRADARAHAAFEALVASARPQAAPDPGGRARETKLPREEHP